VGAATRRARTGAPRRRERAKLAEPLGEFPRLGLGFAHRCSLV
jgi:hypothetical protein